MYFIFNKGDAVDGLPTVCRLTKGTDTALVVVNIWSLFCLLWEMLYRQVCDIIHDKMYLLAIRLNLLMVKSSKSQQYCYLGKDMIRLSFANATCTAAYKQPSEHNTYGFTSCNHELS